MAQIENHRNGSANYYSFNWRLSAESRYERHGGALASRRCEE
jgi:hypothetical protein